MLSIGLTGGIGSGKTTVARFFRLMGVSVLEADLVVHRLLKPKTSVWRQVVSCFGKSILVPDNIEIDRNRLAEVAFIEPGALNRLTDILYPDLKAELIKEIEAASRKGNTLFLFDASQILEAGWGEMFDVIVLVKTGVDISIKRLLKMGGLSLDQIQLRRYFQWPDWVKLRYADFFIDNNGPVWRTKELAELVYKQIIGMSKY